MVARIFSVVSILSDPRVVVFFSAALYFLLEFMAGKWLLPIFGGSWAVWLTVLSFFTTMLLCGYLYAYQLLKSQPRTQRVVHRTMVMLSAAAVIALTIFAVNGVPVPHAIGIGNSAPALEILGLLTLLCALPALVLASTSTLMQRWHYKNEHTYQLYRFSNLGSFAGLLGYPLVYEWLFSVPTQFMLWGGAVLVFFAVLTYITMQAAPAVAPAALPRTHAAHRGAWVQWALLAAFPAALMAATTAQITHVVAPVPLLWMIPLGLYLLSYVYAFSQRRVGFFMYAAFIGLSLLALFLLDAGVMQYLGRLLVYLALLFVASTIVHRTLFNMRPDEHGLARFYVALALGGALGTSVVSFLAPVVFNELWEYPIVVATAVLLSGALFAYRYVVYAGVWAARAIAVVVCVFALYQLWAFGEANLGYTGVERNFYGITTVIETGVYTTLLHEQTVHGKQLVDKPHLPTAYFTIHSAVGRLFGYQRVIGHPGEPLSVGVVGLGVGTVAAYCNEGDTFVFFEIDPRIERIAREHFTYLAQCPQAYVKIGDGRRLLEQEHASGSALRYDILMLDAFNDDTVPAHLVTKEALQLYLSLLKHDDSVIVFQASNRYLALPKLMVALAQDAGLSAIVMEGDVSMDEASLPSTYVLMSKSDTVFKRELFTQGSVPLPKNLVRPWSDAYSNIVPLLAIPAAIGAWF